MSGKSASGEPEAGLGKRMQDLASYALARAWRPPWALHSLRCWEFLWRIFGAKRRFEHVDSENSISSSFECSVGDAAKMLGKVRALRVR